MMTPTRELRILIVEDVETDAELMKFELRQGGINFIARQVHEREPFLQAMGEFRPDLILSDYHLPHWNGVKALALAREKCPEVPFIFVSGAMGEELAIETLKTGATDYVLKNRMSRLIPAVRRALEEKEQRRQRRSVQESLRQSEERYRLLVQNIPAVVYKGYFDWSVDFVDNKIEEMTGYPKAEFDRRRKLWSDVILEEDKERAKAAFKRAFKSDKSYVREYRIRNREGKVLWIQDRGQIIEDGDGQEAYASGVFFDITEQRRAAEAVRRTSVYVRSLIEASLDPLVTISADGKIMDVNRATEEVTGVARQELIGQDFSNYFTEPEKARLGYKRVFSEGLVKDYPLALRHVSGKVTDVLYNAAVYRTESGEVQGVFAAARDITERKKMEEALRSSEQTLRFLTAQLLTAQERERKRVSMELHDELGQGLTVLKLQVRQIERELREDQPELKEDCRRLLTYLDEVIDNVRRISRDLSPAILEDLGLIPALRHLFEEFGKHCQVEFSCNVANLDGLLPQDKQIILYRICQEALNNILKHARATRISAVMNVDGARLSLTLEDNGRGFEMGQVLGEGAGGRGLGLTALDERARMLGGTLHIHSNKGAGTKITCQVPVARGERELSGC